MAIANWKSQLRKGAAELAVLALLRRRSLSGIGILDALAARPEIGLSDGSIYPLLNRLEREGRVKGAWETPRGGGRGQKSYALTASGKTALTEMTTAWCGFEDQLSAIIGGR